MLCVREKEAETDKCHSVNSYLVKRLKADPEKFHMVYPDPEMVNVCFWYIPERLRGVPHGPERMRELGKVRFQNRSPEKAPDFFFDLRSQHN